MKSLDAIRQSHAREMKELRQSLVSASRRRRQDLGKMDKELGVLKRRWAYVPAPVQKPVPLHARILSLLF